MRIWKKVVWVKKKNSNFFFKKNFCKTILLAFRPQSVKKRHLAYLVLHLELLELMSQSGNICYLQLDVRRGSAGEGGGRSCKQRMFYMVACMTIVTKKGKMILFPFSVTINCMLCQKCFFSHIYIMLLVAFTNV